MILCYRSGFFHSMSYFQNFSMLLNFASHCGIKCNHMFSSNTLICSPSDKHLDFFQLLLPKTTLHISSYGPAWSSLIHRAYSCLSLINATECSPGWMNLISLPTKNEATHSNRYEIAISYLFEGKWTKFGPSCSSENDEKTDYGYVLKNISQDFLIE